MLLKDKIVVVSGIGPGMGRDISLSCAEHGADIVLAARTAKKLEEVAEEVRALGRKALCVPTDISDPTQRKNLIQTAIKEMGKVDALVNNAFSQPSFTMLADLDLEEWNKSMEINCTAALGLTQELAPHLKERKTGSIIMINTMSIRLAQPFFGAYAAAKSALFSITRTLANELGPDNIRVNGVAPGYIWGDSVKWYFESIAKDRDVSPEEVKKEHEEQMALRHIPDSKEISGAVVFFASDLSAAVTGHTIDANGGQYLHF